MIVRKTGEEKTGTKILAKLSIPPMNSKDLLCDGAQAKTANRTEGGYPPMGD